MTSSRPWGADHLRPGGAGGPLPGLRQMGRGGRAAARDADFQGALGLRAAVALAIGGIPSVWIVSGCCEVVGAFLWGEKRDSTIRPTALDRPATVRSAALRRSALSLAKAFSIGLKSGL